MSKQTNKSDEQEIISYLSDFFSENAVLPWLNVVSIDTKGNDLLLSGSDSYISEIYHRYRTGFIKFSIEKNKQIILHGSHPKIGKTSKYIIDKEFCSSYLTSNNI